jgi:hypothetical protein
MPYTMQEFKRELAREYLRSLPADMRRDLLRAEIPVEERLRELLLLSRLSPEQRMAGLRPEQIEAYLKRLRKKPATTGRKKPKRGS